MKENPHNFLSYTLSSPYSHLTFTSLTESFYSPLETLAELEEWDGCVTLCWSRFTLMFQRNSSDWSVGGIWYVCLGKQFSHIFDLLLFFIIDVFLFFFGDSLPHHLLRIVKIQLMTGHWHNGVSIKLILIIELDLVLTHRLATLLWKTLFYLCFIYLF